MLFSSTLTFYFNYIRASCFFIFCFDVAHLSLRPNSIEPNAHFAIIRRFPFKRKLIWTQVEIEDYRFLLNDLASNSKFYWKYDPKKKW